MKMDGDDNMNKTEKSGIDLTEVAAREICRIMRGQDFDVGSVFLRVGLKTTGEAEPRCVLELVEQVDDQDATFDLHGIRIVCAKDQLYQLEGILIDYRGEDQSGPGFVVERQMPSHRETVDRSCSPPDEQDVYETLHQVIDPEVGVNVADLGLIYGITIEERRVRVTMTMTTPACPLTESIKADIVRRICVNHPGVEAIDVEIVWEPAWTPEKMSQQAKQQLGWP